MKNLKEADVTGKRVVYRAPYDLPVENGVIQDDLRLVATLPTLQYLVEKGAKIIILNHMGRPGGKVVPELENRPIAQWLADEFPKQTVRLAHKMEDPEVDKALAEMKNGDFLVMPNVRFYAEEEAANPVFGQTLAKLGDLYVDDAFANIHRAHASMIEVPKHLPSYPGFLLEAELKHLGGLLDKPEHPFVVVMGGAKVGDKIQLIKSLAKVADHILIGGALANDFLLAKGEDISESVAEPDKTDLAKQLMEELGEKLVLAADYIKDELPDGKFKYLDIGEKAVEQFKGYLKDAKTVFWNGSLGYTEDERFAKASTEIAKYIAGLKATSIIAGGDTDELIDSLKMRDKFTFVSTGGGAALELLGGNKLPGVEALENSK